MSKVDNQNKVLPKKKYGMHFGSEVVYVQSWCDEQHWSFSTLISMIISHITYCLTTWSHASITTLKPLESLYKQSLKTLDKKSVQFHHCSILKKYNLLSWDNLIKYVHICLLFKTMNSLISPLKQFVNIRTTAHRSTRGGERGDCVIPFKRSNFSQSVFSVQAAREWNSIPSTIRRLHTFGSFQSHLKKWLLTTQHCQH